jgi:3-hydroxyisobutyrate dehydrogenase-like beta-hydroxyacid dehydrogenase
MRLWFRHSPQRHRLDAGMDATSARIGFVGLGHMGGNMAARFLAAGYTVYGEQRSREHVPQLIDQGLQWRDTPREVAEAADVVFTSVPDDRVLEEVASGPDGIIAGLAAGKTWVEVSTVSPQASRELAARACVRRVRGCSTRRSRGAFRRCSQGR